MGYWQVWRFLNAISGIDHLANSNRNGELCAIRESNQNVFPEFGVFKN